MAGGPSSPLNDILDALAAYEAEHDGGSAPSEPLFIRNNEWLVREDYLATLPLYLMPGYGGKIPGLYRTGLFGLFRNAARRGHARYPLASRAQVLQIKATGERLRAFYIKPSDRRHSLKIVSRAYANYDGCKQEVPLRAQLAGLGTISVPSVEAVREDSRYLYSREQLVLGRRFSSRLDRGLFTEAVLPQLLATYRAHGIDRKPIGEYLPPDLEARLHVALGDHPNHASLSRKVSQVIESNPPVAVSLCHGDLLPSNLAVSGRDVYFLDWERAGDGVVAFDLLRMARKYPGVRFFTNQVRTAVESIETAEGCRFEDLRAAYVALSIAQHPERVAHFMDLYRPDTA
jgi:hypothetical protein